MSPSDGAPVFKMAYLMINQPLIHYQSPHISVLLHMLVGVYSWVNDYDHEFTFTCPQHQTITRVVSHHDNHREDRVFDFQCSGKNEITSESCYWTGSISLDFKWTNWRNTSYEYEKKLKTLISFHKSYF